MESVMHYAVLEYGVHAKYSARSLNVKFTRFKKTLLNIYFGHYFNLTFG